MAAEQTRAGVNAEIVAIGSELLLGQIVDTNSAWMAQRLADQGINLFYKTVVGDNPGRMLEIISRAMDRSDVVITSGGLGPTQDDLTREVVAQAAGKELILDPELLAQIQERFRSRGFIMTENNDRQAYIPQGSTPVQNPNGTAPSFIVEDPRAVVFCLPGVPFELKWLFDNEVIPYLRRRFELSGAIFSRVLKVAEMGESSVDDLVGHLIANSTNPTVGVLAYPGQVDVRITAKAANQGDAERLIEPMEREVRQLLGDHIFGGDEQTIQAVVGDFLRQGGNLTVATYEGLTGGLVGENMQDAAGPLFLLGIIGRDHRTLRSLLETNGSTADYQDLVKDGAALTDELAIAVRNQAEADFGLAVHAVPEGGEASENLNAGQTYLSLNSATGTVRRHYNFAGPGLPDRTRTALNSLNLLRITLQRGR